MREGEEGGEGEGGMKEDGFCLRRPTVNRARGHMTLTH